MCSLNHDALGKHPAALEHDLEELDLLVNESSEHLGNGRSGDDSDDPPHEVAQEVPSDSMAAHDVRSVTYLDLEDIRRNGVPQIPWLIEGWLAEKDIVLIAGVAGGGKTTLAAHLAICLAQKQPWLGMEPRKACNVLYFDEEQDSSTTSRLFLRLIAPPIPPNLRVASGNGLRLDCKEDLALIEREIATYRPSVIVLDTVQQVFGSTDENNATEVGRIYRSLFRLRDRHGVTIALLHHFRKRSHGSSGSAPLELVRGSTAHGTQPSTVWCLSPGEVQNTSTIRQVKRRGAPKQTLSYRYEEARKRITLVPTEAPKNPRAQAADWIIGFLAERETVQTGDIITAGEAEGHSKGSLERAMKDLVDQEAIEKPVRGSYRLRVEEIGGESS